MYEEFTILGDVIYEGEDISYLIEDNKKRKSSEVKEFVPNKKVKLDQPIMTSNRLEVFVLGFYMVSMIHLAL
jgi:hypothetical protein